jgi:transcriptional regulator with XRE-family HTH domain
MRNPERDAKDICAAIGRRIKAIRQEKRLTLDQVAAKTGFAKSYLSQIENLKREPPISTLTKIAFVLGVDIFFLISGEVRQSD